MTVLINTLMLFLPYISDHFLSPYMGFVLFKKKALFMRESEQEYGRGWGGAEEEGE